jgi:hypothetical protein
MDHLCIQEELLVDHSERIFNHEDRLQAIEAALVEHGVMKANMLVVPTAITKRIAAAEDMTLQEFYQLLIDKKVIVPAAERSTWTMRINGVPIRVVQMQRKAGEEK